MNAPKSESLQRLVLKLRTIQTISSRIRTLENNIENSALISSESMKPDETLAQDLFRTLSELLEAISLSEIKINQLETRLSSIEDTNQS